MDVQNITPEIGWSQIKIMLLDHFLQILLLLSLFPSLLFFCFGQSLFADSLLVIHVSKFPDLFQLGVIAVHLNFLHEVCHGIIIKEQLGVCTV